MINFFLDPCDKIGLCATWCGGNDLAQENVYTWIKSGTTDLYTNWRGGEPNGDRRANCINVFYSGAWNDEICDKKILNFICEM